MAGENQYEIARRTSLESEFFIAHRVDAGL